MRKYLFILLFSCISLLANEATDLADKLHFMKSYPKALEISKKDQNILMLIIVEDGCHWCKKFARTTLKDAVVQQKLEAFTKVIIDKEDEAAQRYEAHFFPMIYFVDPNTQKVLDTAYGYQKTEGFLTHIKKAKQQYNKER